MARTPTEARRTTALIIAAVAAIPFWAMVAYLDPLGHRLAEAPAAPLVVPPAPRLSPFRCLDLQDQLQQSRRECMFEVRRGRTDLPPGDFPLRGATGLMIAGGELRAGGI